MDVPTDRDGRVDLLDVGLFNEDLLGEVAQVAHLTLPDVLTASQLLNLPI